MTEPNETFQCVVISPRGKLLECETVSVVFPAHDGQVGVWRNHMPMLCKLGLGIMSVENAAGEVELQTQHTYLLIDGGFAQVSNNLLTIITQDAICFKDMEAEKIEKVLESEKNKLAHGVFSPQQRKHEEQKLSFLMKLAEMSSPVNNK
jgi:F-type H+-transporting ATPase subunit epsilon